MSLAGRLVQCSNRNKETCEKREKKVLLRSINSKYRHVGGDRPYTLSEFHLVDFETNEIHTSYLPPLINCGGDGRMVASDETVYILGGLISNVDDGSHFKLLKSNSPESEKEFYLGGSCFDLRQQSKGGVWTPFPDSINHYSFTLYTVLSGKIYAIGYRIRGPEVFDPTVGHWKTLCIPPPELDRAFPAFELLPDPSNNRILVHFSRPKPALYAFTPPTDVDDTQPGGGTWECFASDFPCFTHLAVVVDSVLFIYAPKIPSRFRVFDIARKTWLKVCWSGSFDDGLNMNETKIEFDALLPLSDKIFCLAVWSPNYDRDDLCKPVTDIQVIFAKFTVERIGDTINLIPLSTHTHLLPDTYEVSQYLAV